jgi:hypothetical protein
MIKLTILFMALGLISYGVDMFVMPLPPFGSWAYALFPESFPILQPAIERHVSPWVWRALLQPIFVSPITFLFLVLAAISAIIAGLIALLNRRNAGPQ